MRQEFSSSAIPVFPMPWLEGEKQGPVRVVAVKGTPLIQQEIWLSPHRKNYYMLQYVTQGSGRHWVDMIPYEYSANTLYFSSPEQVHVKEEVNITGTVITFTKEFLAMEQNLGLDRLPLTRNQQNAHELKLGPLENAELEIILEKCVSEYQQDADLQTEMLYSYLRVLLTFLSRIYNVHYNDKEPNTSRDLYRRFQASLEENFMKDHDAQEYSNRLHISASHLNALIKEQSGKTVTAHIHERLILETKRMLFHTDHTVKQIAFSMGFQDTSYFSRFFKRLTSCTPLEYRQQIRR
jgi:AraC family transcriptional activator of pobA